MYSRTNKINIEVEVKGTKPNKGKVKIEGNKISLRNVELNGKTYYQITKLLEDVSPIGISPGDKYEYEVSPGIKYKFYVLSLEGTGENQKVNLIMDRNICADGTTDYANDRDNNYCRYAWYSSDDNSFGPLTSMTVLGNATRKWINVPNMNLTYDDTENNNTGTYGYTGITIKNGVGYIINKDGTAQIPITVTDTMPIKARLPKESEVAGTGAKCINGVNGSCEPWLVDNLSYSSFKTDKYSLNDANIPGTAIYNINGYWLLTSVSGAYNIAHLVHYYGTVSGTGTSADSYVGIRPVIIVPAFDLS